MVIIGAKGFAREVLEILYQLQRVDNVAFYDDINTDLPDKLYDKFPVLRNENELQAYFKKNGNEFTLGLGKPNVRYQLYKKIVDLGGQLTSTISPKATIGHFGNEIEEGINLMSNVVLTNDIKIKKGTLINLSATIGHNCIIEDFVEICPNVNISGNCVIGKFSFIGTSATILPGITIGTNAIVGAGAVVTKNVPDNEVWIGNPAKFFKKTKLS